MKFVADFHIHSKYSRATSPQMNIPNLAQWAKYKGVGLLGTGDFTHHLWLQELKKYLQPQSKTGLHLYKDIYFILSAEISSIYTQKGKVYRVHNLILAPSFEIVEEINKMLATYGNISNDGRPILGMSCIKIAQELFSISGDIMLIPAHIWTPWFSLFGSRSGFDKIEDAYGKHTENIAALETGLSSDPAMNWMVSQIDKFSLVSNSDSHSLSRIGREANIFDCELNYWEIKKALKDKDKDKFLYTIEFFPQEGKYYYDGHRDCKQRLDPEQTKKQNGICSVCNKPVTKGVLSRVQELADKPLGFVLQDGIPYKSFVPLDEIIAESIGVGVKSKAVQKNYLDIVQRCKSEFNVLVKMSEAELIKQLPEHIAQGVMNIRKKEIEINPGYDGEYGTVKILKKTIKASNKSLYSST